MSSKLNKNQNYYTFKRKSRTKELYSEDRSKNICFNFRYLDKTQGQIYNFTDLK